MANNPPGANLMTKASAVRNPSRCKNILLWIVIPLKGSSLKSKASGSLRHVAHSSPELHNI
jgi:hypothetical protein